MSTRPRRASPMRVIATEMRDGSRQVVLACACVRVGRLFAPWEPDDEIMAILLEDHARRAPLCRHPLIPASARPLSSGRADAPVTR